MQQKKVTKKHFGHFEHFKRTFLHLFFGGAGAFSSLLWVFWALYSIVMVQKGHTKKYPLYCKNKQTSSGFQKLILNILFLFVKKRKKN